MTHLDRLDRLCAEKAALAAQLEASAVALNRDVAREMKADLAALVWAVGELKAHPGSRGTGHILASPRSARPGDAQPARLPHD